MQSLPLSCSVYYFTETETAIIRSNVDIETSKTNRASSQHCCTNDTLALSFNKGDWITGAFLMR